MSNSILAPFMPLEFKRIHIYPHWFGLMFAGDAFGVVFMSPLISPLIQAIGRRNSILLGNFLYGLAFFAFGSLSMLDTSQTRNNYIALTTFFRFLGGCASTIIRATLYSVVTNFYSENQMEFIGYIQSVKGGALILGPSIGFALN